MRKILILLFLAILAPVSFAAQEKAAGEKKEKTEKKAAAAKEDRWSGTIQRQYKDSSTLIVRKGNIDKTVVYDASTKWTQGKKTADASLFKDGVRVIALGKYDEKGRLIATRIDLRPPR